MVIRRAKIQEIPKIMALTKACSEHMTDRGIYQWNDNYPTAEIFENDIARDELFVLVNETEFIGVIAITTKMDQEYYPVSWLTPNDKNIYVHRLAVHPEFQGKGYAQKLMAFAELRARQSKSKSVRLDTFSKNKRNQRFYEQRGYAKLEDIYIPLQSEYPFHCYELVL